MAFGLLNTLPTSRSRSRSPAPRGCRCCAAAVLTDGGSVPLPVMALSAGRPPLRNENETSENKKREERPSSCSPFSPCTAVSLQGGSINQCPFSTLPSPPFRLGRSSSCQQVVEGSSATGWRAPHPFPPRRVPFPLSSNLSFDFRLQPPAPTPVRNGTPTRPHALLLRKCQFASLRAHPRASPPPHTHTLVGADSKMS